MLVGVIVVLDMGSEAFDRLGHKFFLDNGGWEDDSLIGLGVLFLVLSDALFATGDYHYAAYALRRALELDPGIVQSMRNQGQGEW